MTIDSQESAAVAAKQTPGGAVADPAWPQIERGLWCSILKEDPDLGWGLSDRDQRAAVHAFRAPVLSVSRPRWEPPAPASPADYGLLVLDGLLGRRVRVGAGVATELLGAGDILRPWDEPMRGGMIPPELDWRVFRPTRLAILNEQITTLIGRRPQLIINFSERLLRRARSIAYLTAISHIIRVEDKLLATLWHLASSWGNVTPDGVRVPFRLTHEVLGEILGAQRPSVTTALHRLRARGEVRRGPDGGYLLLGDPANWNVRAAIQADRRRDDPAASEGPASEGPASGGQMTGA